MSVNTVKEKILLSIADVVYKLRHVLCVTLLLMVVALLCPGLLRKITNSLTKRAVIYCLAKPCEVAAYHSALSIYQTPQFCGLLVKTNHHPKFASTTLSTAEEYKEFGNKAKRENPHIIPSDNVISTLAYTHPIMLDAEAYRSNFRIDGETDESVAIWRAFWVRYLGYCIVSGNKAEAEVLTNIVLSDGTLLSGLSTFLTTHKALMANEAASDWYVHSFLNIANEVDRRLNEEGKYSALTEDSRKSIREALYKNTLSTLVTITKRSNMDLRQLNEWLSISPLWRYVKPLKAGENLSISIGTNHVSVTSALSVVEG